MNANSTLENSQIELLLSEQDNKLQAVIEILQIILINLNDKSVSQENQEKLRMIMEALLALNSNDQEINTLHKRNQADTQKSLDNIKQENQDLRTYCQQIKQHLKKQDRILEEHFSIKKNAFQYCSIALLTALTTVVGIRFLPLLIDFVLPSKNDPELQKTPSEKPVKALQKSK